MGVEVKGVGIKLRGIKIMRRKPKPFKSFIFSHRKRDNEASDAKNNFNRRSSDMHHLRYVDFLWLIHAKGGGGV